MKKRIDEKLWTRVDAQARNAPELFAHIDFEKMPERFTSDANGDGLEAFGALLDDVRADDVLMDRIAAYTMMGDPLADAYVRLLPDYGPRRLAQMLDQACMCGAGALSSPPEALLALVDDIESAAGRVDMALVDEGARLERNSYVHLVPFAIRGAFLATFMNAYSALPMALNGGLGQDRAAGRIRATAHFFSLTVLPGALRRHGAAVRAAARVRLIHAMVRRNLMLDQNLWPSSVYGVAIPQVDQMPAGQMSAFLLAFSAVSAGRRRFTDEERARVEIAKLRCLLMGLSEDLLGDDPLQIARLMVARQATLRPKYDDAICGELVRGALACEVSAGEPRSGLEREMERSFSKAFFIRAFLRGDARRARQMGITLSPRDRSLAALAGVQIFAQERAFRLLGTIPVVRDLADGHLIGRLRQQLKAYGGRTA